MGDTSSSPRQPSRLSFALLGADAFLAARPATPVQVVHACTRAGYDATVPATWGDELIAARCTERLADRTLAPAVFCACSYVRDRLLAPGPDLAPFVLSFVAPPVAAARYLRQLHADQHIDITYVGVCPSADDDAIDRQVTPAAFFADLRSRGISLAQQPTVFDSTFAPDRRRCLSQPGGLPAARLLQHQLIQRSLVEIGGFEYAADLAQHLILNEPVLIDISARAGCACSGAAIGVPPLEARRTVIALEPPRSAQPVVEPDVMVMVDLPLAPPPGGDAPSGVGRDVSDAESDIESTPVGDIPDDIPADIARPTKEPVARVFDHTFDSQFDRAFRTAFVPRPDAGIHDVGLSDIRPSNVLPSDVRPSDVRPSDVRPSDVRPSDIRPSDIRPSDIRPSDIRPSDIRPADIRQLDIRPADVRPADVRPSIDVTASIESSYWYDTVSYSRRIPVVTDDRVADRPAERPVPVLADQRRPSRMRTPAGGVPRRGALVPRVTLAEHGDSDQRLAVPRAYAAWRGAPAAAAAARESARGRVIEREVSLAPAVESDTRGAETRGAETRGADARAVEPRAVDVVSEREVAVPLSVGSDVGTLRLVPAARADERPVRRRAAVASAAPRRRVVEEATVWSRFARWCQRVPLSTYALSCAAVVVTAVFASVTVRTRHVTASRNMGQPVKLPVERHDSTAAVRQTDRPLPPRDSARDFPPPLPL